MTPGSRGQAKEIYISAVLLHQGKQYDFHAEKCSSVNCKAEKYSALKWSAEKCSTEKCSAVKMSYKQSSAEQMSVNKGKEY